jgi:hypothetical protein
MFLFRFGLIVSVPSLESCPPPPESEWLRTPSEETQTQILAGEGVGGPNSDEGTKSLVLLVYYNPFTMYPYNTRLLNILVRMKIICPFVT